MDYMRQLPREFLANSSNLGWGAGRVRSAWHVVRESLTELVEESALMDEVKELLSEVLAEMGRYERCEGRIVGLVPYVMLVKSRGGGAGEELVPNLAMVIHGDRADIMVVSMAATAHTPALAHVILHELVHSAGFISRREEIDELATDYVVNEVINHSNGRIAGEAELKYSPKCVKGCGILGAAAQYLIDKGRYVHEEEFMTHIEEYLNRGVTVNELTNSPLGQSLP